MSTKFSPEQFIGFLHDIDPLSTYTIVQLSGGLVNFTVRAIKNTDANTGFFVGHKTLVIKHAAPFVAFIGEDAPLSPFRQVVESRALELLNARSISQEVTIPSVLFHDNQRHMLVITDLGDDLSTIDKWIGTNPGGDKVAGVARRLSGFLATLHTLDVPESSLQNLDNPDVVEAIERNVVDRVNDTLETFQIEKKEARQLGEMLKTAYRAKPERWVFSVGDLWIGSILVSPLGEKVAVVDWENAGRGKPLQDLAQFASHFNNPSLKTTEEVLVKELFDSYRRGVSAANAGWIAPSSYRDEAIKSAWILHGREILYRAGELPEGDIERLALAEHGLKYLRAANGGLSRDDILEERFLQSLYLSED
ncbi:hypothetical protein V5O48_002698 [Marasmius crinis-equi]|uniref:Aminoglycoside phosphotransferase domain-containing protein n=1 Tax=Marasmius crinis-equi TaxID=585013 RepID=A0ABR3FUX5_9AGAR